MEKSGRGQTGDSGHGILSDDDISRIAGAVTDGIKKVKPDKPPSVLMWLVVAVLLSTAIAFGAWGFITRPSQNATFRGNFATGSIVSIKANPDLNHDVHAVVSSLEIRGHDKPIKLHLYMAEEQRKAFAVAIGQSYQEGMPVEVDGPIFKFNFTRPVSTVITAQKAGEVSLDRMSAGENTYLVRLTAKNLLPQPDISRGPAVEITVFPPQNEVSFQVSKADIDLGNFSLLPGPIDRNAKVTLVSSASPGSREYGDIVDLSFPDKEPVMLAYFCQAPDNITDTRAPGGQEVAIDDVPGGVIALGSVTQTLAAGERLRITLNRPQEVSITNNRIEFDALDETRVTNAKRNEVVNLLPLRFTLWPDWAQQLWRWGAITLGAGTFLALMRKFNLWWS